MKSISLVAVFLLFLTVNETASQVKFPLKTSVNGRYLADQNDVPFPVLGRTSWCVISQPEADYKYYLDNTLSHGYNSIEMSVICHWPQSNYPPFNGRGDLPFRKSLDGSPWNGYLGYSDMKNKAADFTTPDENYWRYVDDLLEYCESKGILVFIFPAYLGAYQTKEGWLNELMANGPDRIFAYGKWIAGRYKNRKNLVWMLIGDMGKFTPEEAGVEAALIAGLKSVGGQQSTHYSAEAMSGQNSTDQTDFGHEMTLNGVYSWGNVSIPLLGNKAYARTPVLPAFLLEEPYDEEGPDGNKFNPHAIQPVRRFQWWGWLTTTGGYIAGNGYIWAFIDLWWQKHLNTKATMDMVILNKLIRSTRWWELVPSGQDGMKNLITNGGNAPADTGYIASAATRSGSLLIAYIPPAHRGSFSVDMSVMKGRAEAKWLDPSSGEYSTIAGSPFTGSEPRTFSIPGKNKNGDSDWVLILENKDITP